MGRIPGHQLQPLGRGGQVAEDADGIEAAQLGHPGQVDSPSLQLSGLRRGRVWIPGVVDGHASFM
jgi:hypothetical protein